MNTSLVAIHFLDEVLGILSMSVAQFWSAVRMDGWPAWAAIAVMSVCMTAMGIVILRLTQLARYILAGLDQRHGWTGGFPLAAQIAAIAGLSWAMPCWNGLWPPTVSSRKSSAYSPIVVRLS